MSKENKDKKEKISKLEARLIRKKGKLETKLILSMTLIFLFTLISTAVSIIWGNFEEEVGEVRKDIANLAYVAVSGIPSVVDLESDVASQLTLEELSLISSTQGEEIEYWLEHGPDDDYYHCIDVIKKWLEEWGLADIFVYKATEDENGELLNDMIVILDVPATGESDYKFGQHYVGSKAFETVKKVYETGEPQTYDRSAYNESGFILVAFAPVRYSDGSVCAVLGAEISMGRIMVDVLSSNVVVLLNTALNFWIFGIVMFIFIRRSIVKPVGILSSHMREFVSDEDNITFSPVTEIHTKDEIEQMADDYNALAERIVDYTRNLAVKTSEEERLKLDLDVASQIRNVVSSEMLYPAFPGRTDFDLCASLKHTMYNKCSFINYFFTDNNRLFMIIGESLGNNLASMILSIITGAYIMSFAKMGLDPSKIAAETNNQICSNEKKDAGMTVGVIIADIDLKTGTMRYVNAGMPPMLVKRPGENYMIEKPERPFSLGQMRGISFDQKMIQLYQGSTVLLTSFGISEMTDENGSKYGIERLIGVMNRISGNVYDLDKTIIELEKDLETFRGEAPVSLDTAVLGFRYFG